MVVLSSFVHPDSSVLLEQRNITAILDKKNLGVGTLFISERTLCWKADNIGFSLTYPHISLHAISNDPAVYQSQCIYVMIDSHVRLPGVSYENVVTDANSESDEESEADISELLLIPQEPTTVQNIYEALKECQELNPDPEDEEDDDIYEDADENMDEGNEDGYGGGGDNDMENIVNQIRSNTMDINYDYSNGDHISEDIFEDAD